MMKEQFSNRKILMLNVIFLSRKSMIELSIHTSQLICSFHLENNWMKLSIIRDVLLVGLKSSFKTY